MDRNHAPLFGLSVERKPRERTIGLGVQRKWEVRLIEHIYAQHNSRIARVFVPQQKHDTCGVRTHALADWRLEPAP